MSSPPAYEERYEVTSITGYKITPDLHSLDIDGKSRTEWYVVDRFHCYEIVRTCRTESMARKHCHLLNRLERRWEMTGS